MADKLTPYDFPEAFNDFTLMPRFGDDIDHLAGIAEPEDWDYKHALNPIPKPILRNYLRYTYKRIAEEKKVAITADEEFACWNTGLITPNQEPIFILFERNKFPEHQSYWHFWRFARRGEWELNRFVSLPEMAHYFDDPSLLAYDTTKRAPSKL
jgi:Domain of unknown function (DUF3825)